MSELKVHKAYNRWLDEEMPTPNDDLICNEVYLKSEADKFIADLEESHKKEVGQLLIEIAELKKEKEYVIEHTAEVINGQEREIRHHKYKRFLANAEACMHKRWRNDEGFDYARSTRHMNTWLAIAEKFITNSTAQ